MENNEVNNSLPSMRELGTSNTREPQPERKYDFDRVVRIIITLVTVGCILYAIDYLSPVLLPFLVGCLMAYVLNPLVDMIQRCPLTRNRAVAVVVTLLLVIAIVGGALWLLIPYIIAEFAGMGKMLAAYAESNIHMPYIPDVVTEYIKSHIDLSQWDTMLTKEQWFEIANNVFAGTWSVVGGTVSVVLSIVSSLIVLLYMFFVLMDFNKISKGFKAMVPRRYRRMTFRILRDVQETMSGYFRGQALVSLLVGIVFAIEFSIIGLPMAIVFGLFVGVLNMVPYLQLVSFPIAMFLGLVASVATGTSFLTWFLWIFGAYCLCQVIQDLVFIPLIMKEQMGLNPAIIFLALSLWAYILGFIGLIVGLPLTTIIISYYNEFVLDQPNPLHHRKHASSRKPLLKGFANWVRRNTSNTSV